VYGLSLAKGLIAGGIARRVLLVTAETYSKHIHAMDKSVRTIFGDGAAASLIDAAEQDGLGQFVLGTDGAGYQTIIVPTGAMRQARSAETGKEETDDSGNIRARDNLFMDGPDVFNFTLDVVPETVSRVLEKNHMSTDDVDLFVFHQANLFMLNTLRKALGLPKEKFVVNMADIGNTVSSTIPIALARAEADGTLRRGMKVMLVGFGVGLSWGATIITW
jgi:3-oxoacyl-[acyl-carrier-protein] synthase-3